MHKTEESLGSISASLDSTKAGMEREEAAMQATLTAREAMVRARVEGELHSLAANISYRFAPSAPAAAAGFVFVLFVCARGGGRCSCVNDALMCVNDALMCLASRSW